jgi:hypothetical protein
MFGVNGPSPIGRPLQALALGSSSLPALGELCDRLLHADNETEQTMANVRLAAAGQEGAEVSVIAKRLPSQPEQPPQVLLMFDHTLS